MHHDFFLMVFFIFIFFMQERKNVWSFSKICFLDNGFKTDSCAFGGGGQSNVGSLMLRDSDCVCDGEYGNSDNVSLLQVVKVL